MKKQNHTPPHKSSGKLTKYHKTLLGTLIPLALLGMAEVGIGVGYAIWYYKHDTTNPPWVPPFVPTSDLFVLDDKGALFLKDDVNKDNVVNVGIPKLLRGAPVLSIGVDAFLGCNDLESVAIEKGGCKVIGDGAFYHCSNLRTVNLGDIQVIGRQAFSGCKQLGKDLIMPDSVESIGYGAFLNCSYLCGDLYLSKNLHEIGSLAFYGCDFYQIKNSIGKLGTDDFGVSLSVCSFGNTTRGVIKTNSNNFTFIDDSVIQGCCVFGRNIDLSGFTNIKEIGNDAFSQCNGVYGNLILPSNLEKIGANAFYRCEKLYGELRIPNSVKTLGEGCFGECENLSTLILGSGIRTIGNGSFHNCTKITGDLIIPSSTESIGSGAFYNCKKLKSLAMTNVVSIGATAFQNCIALTGQLKFPDSAQTIGDSAFEGCKGFNSITIGTGLKWIGNKSFYNCINLIGAWNTNDKISKNTDNIYYIKSNNVYYCLGGWQNVSANNTGAINKIEIISNTKIIAPNAFANCSQTVTNLTIPDTVVSICDSAFYNCEGISGSLVIPTKTELIGNHAFERKNSSATGPLFTSLSLPNNLVSIGDYAFSYAINLSSGTSLMIPDKVKTIGDYAFAYTVLNSLTIGTGVTSIGHSAFRQSGISGSLSIPDSVKIIGDYAFYKNSFNSTLTIGSSVESIGDNSFYGDLFTGNLSIPDSVKTIGNGAFDTTSVAHFTNATLSIGQNVSYIGNKAFEMCTFIGQLSIGQNVSYIGAAAFISGQFSGELVLSNSLTVGTGAFLGCDKFTKLTFKNIAEEPANWGKYIFEGWNTATGCIVSSIESSWTSAEALAFAKSEKLPNNWTT